MARTLKAIIFRRIVDCAGQMRTFLSVGDVLLFTRTNQDAVVLRRRVGEEFHASHRNFAECRYLRRRIDGLINEVSLRQNPQVTDEHAQARESQELGELPSRDVALVARENGEFLFPEWFFTGAAKKRHTTPPTCSREHRGKLRPCRPEPSCARELRFSDFRIGRRLSVSRAGGRSLRAARRPTPDWGRPWRTSASCRPMYGRST